MDDVMPPFSYGTWNQSGFVGGSINSNMMMNYG
mgnify:CR=1 FL=1